MKAMLCRAVSFCVIAIASAQDGGWKFPCPSNDIACYTAQRVPGVLHIDGKLDEPEWRAARWSPRFTDILTGGPVIHDTRAAVLWDDDYLYVAYRVEEPFVQAKFTNHNDLIWQDNDVECFIAGPDAYYEFEINAFNTSYEVFLCLDEYIHKFGAGVAAGIYGHKARPVQRRWLREPSAWRARGKFRAYVSRHETAVHIDGTVNDNTDRDRGWTVELALPWKRMKWLATDGRPLPPKDGDVWRMDFSRFNTYKEAPPAQDSGGWFWTRHGVWDSHIPECFTYVTFSTNAVRVKKASQNTP